LNPILKNCKGSFSVEMRIGRGIRANGAAHTRSQPKGVAKILPGVYYPGKLNEECGGTWFVF